MEKKTFATSLGIILITFGAAKLVYWLIKQKKERT